MIEVFAQVVQNVDVWELVTALKPLFTLLNTVLIGGVATAVVTELLKHPAVAFPAQKFPRLTALVLSVVASVIAVWQTGFDYTQVTGWAGWIVMVLGIFLISAATYRAVLKSRKDSDTPPTSI